MKDFIKKIVIFTLVFVNMMNINAAFAETETVSLTIRPVVNEKKIDNLINAGMVVKKGGEEVLEDTKKEVELGTTITIRAVDGNKSFFKGWKRPGGLNKAEFLAIFGSTENTPELTFKITEEFKRKNIKIIEASYNLFTEIDPRRTDLSKGEVDIEVTGKGANLQSKNGYPLGESNDVIRFKAIPKAGYEFERWEFIWALPIIGPTSSLNKDVSETDPEIVIKLTPIPEVGAYPANYLPVIAHFKESEKQENTVSFNTNGGNGLAEQRIKLGEKVEKPIDPVKQGYKFLGWYIDKELNHPFDFNTNIEQDITLYAKWKDNNKSIDPNDYIIDIKIPLSPKSPDINTTFFHRYEIKDNKIVFYIGKDNESWKNPTFRAFLGFTDPVMGFGGLMNYKLIIGTKGIKEIKVDNYVYDETIPQENGQIQKSTAIKNLVGSSSQWKEGIWFNNFGTRVVYTDKDGKITTDFNRSRFDKDNPPEFTFVTDDEDEFKLTWEAIKVEPKEEEIEKRIELTVKADPTTFQLHDGQVNGGIRDGEGTINYKELKLGEKANITAIDGNKSFFSQWYISMLEDNKFKELFGVEKTTRDIEFIITEDFF